ncbi:MAG TPA: DUF933 domain-containing protein [Planctomycetota bacterium]|nr:DUF933 domain-containing protein [Planctomycetota bacterium]
MNIGIIGLPQSGKSTIFRAVAAGQEAQSHDPTKPRIAVVKVPDERMEWLREHYKPKKFTLDSIEFLDFAGLFDTSPEAPRDSRVFAAVRDCDALMIVLRGFASDIVPHPKGSIDPVRDLGFIEAEMLLADLDMAERRIERLEVDVKRPRPTQMQDQLELDVLKRCRDSINEERPIASLQLKPDDEKAIRGFRFLTAKDAVIVVNIGDDQQLDESWRQALAAKYGEVLFVKGEIEAEIAELDEQDRAEFMADMGLEESARDRLIRSAFRALGRGNFFTVGDDEVKAWPIDRDATALEAAGTVHTDLARGFIRAEVVHFDDLKACGSMRDVKAANKLRLEGKEYKVKDGDILNIRFSV